jgi:transcriptional regulator with XRE-family HTH domain
VSSEDIRRKAVAAAVARLLREERERQGLSMTLVASRAGIAQQAVSYIERGMRNPTLETLLRISAVLDLELAEVIRRATASVARK